MLPQNGASSPKIGNKIVPPYQKWYKKIRIIYKQYGYNQATHVI